MSHVAAGSPAAPACCPIHVVTPYDTLASLAAKAGVTPLVFTTFNRLRSDIYLRPGQLINLPCPRALLFFEKLMLSLGDPDSPAVPADG